MGNTRCCSYLFTESSQLVSSGPIHDLSFTVQYGDPGHFLASTASINSLYLPLIRALSQPLMAASQDKFTDQTVTANHILSF